MIRELRHIHAFLAVARRGSFTRAAAELRVSQPALTVQVRQLEAQLGVSLFDRNKRRVALTQAGRDLVAPLERVIFDFESVIANTRDFVEHRRGIVTVGALPSIAAGLLPRAMKRLADDHPGIVVRVTDALAGRIAALVKTGEVISLERPLVLQQRHEEIKRDGKPNGLSFYEMTFRTFPKGDPRGNEDFSSDVQSFAPHGALLTHLDALCHYSDGSGHLYNGFPLETTVTADKGCTRLGIDTLKTGIVTRGILIDATRLRQFRTSPRVFVDDIEAFERQTGLKVGPGDALFVYNPQPPGTRGGIDASVVPWMKERGVALTSNIARVPEDGHADHRLPIVAAGIFLLDSPDLTRLAETAARLNRWEFMLTIAPPLAPGATGYPVNPLAMF